MKVYKSKYGLLTGTSYNEIMAAARREYRIIQKRTPRRTPYVRSNYFTKDKIFLNTFWDHIKHKRSADQQRRLKFYTAAIDLLRNSSEIPDAIFSQSNQNTILHRFYGITKDGQYFIVQVKENKRNNRKDFVSLFPSKKPTYNEKASRWVA